MKILLPALALLLGCGAHSQSAPDDTGTIHDSAADDTGGDSASDDTASDDTAGDDTAGDDTGPQDADGDGFPRWDQAPDPALADCDDTDPSVTPAVERLVPAGPFWRGDEWSLDASPVSEITLSAYCVDVTEVTNVDFVAFLEHQVAQGVDLHEDEPVLYDFEDDDDDVPERIQDDAGTLRVQDGYEDHPVTEVYQWSGELYCAWRGKALPTEAQWEKAARGDVDERDWPWGDEAATCDLANLRLGLEGDPDSVLCVDDTVPVGSYPDAVSPYGALDMAGNVAEWVADWYREDYYVDAPQTDPPGPDEGYAKFPGRGVLPARVTRGGSFGSNYDSTKVWARYVELFDATSNGVGFRCVRPLASN